MWLRFIVDSQWTTGTPLIHTLQQLQHANTSFATSALTAGDLAALMAEIRSAERALTSIKVKIGQRSDHLAAEQAGPDATETFNGGGDVSNNAARTETNRSRTAKNIPEAGDALNEGSISGEHLDSLSRARKTLEPELRESFDQYAGKLVSGCDNTPVDAFNKQVKRLTDKITNESQSRRRRSHLRPPPRRVGVGRAAVPRQRP